MNWEDLCDRCAKCCSIGRDIACPGLDTATNLCSDYENRHSKWLCFRVTYESVPKLHAGGVIPDSCAYVRFLAGKEVTVGTPFDGYARLIPFELSPPKYHELYQKAQGRWLATVSGK